MELAKLFIDGAWCEGSSGRSGKVIDPATGETFASVTHAAPADLDRALDIVEDAVLAG